MIFNKYIAVDIGSKKTKIVCGRVKSKTLEIIEYAIMDTPHDSIIDGKIIDFHALSEALKTTLKENKIKGRCLIFIITGTAIITRDVQIPDSTDEELGKILKFEAQQYFPVDLNTYVMDYRPLERVTTGEGIFVKVQLVAVPQKQVEEYVKFAPSLKKEITAIDISANCLNRYLYPGNFIENKSLQSQNNGKDQDFGIAVLDIGYETIGVSIFSQGILKFQRNLLNGIKDFSSGITNYSDDEISNTSDTPHLLQPGFNGADLFKGTDTNISEIQNRDYSSIEQVGKEYFEESAATCEISSNAQDIIELKDIDLDDPGVQHILAPVLDSILKDLQRFFDFYNTRSNGNKISKIFLYGGGSRIKGLKDYIGQYFNLGTDNLSTGDAGGFANIVYRGKKADFEDCFPLLINAIGSLVR